jgi:hypothetical protein
MAPAYRELDALLRKRLTDRTEMEHRILVGLSWAGQAALAGSNSVRIVAFVTALEAMLLGHSETNGKRSKLAVRISRLPKCPELSGTIAEADIHRLYRERNACLHAGKRFVDEGAVRIAGMVVAHVFSGLLRDENLRHLDTLKDIIKHLAPECGAVGYSEFGVP